MKSRLRQRAVLLASFVYEKWCLLRLDKERHDLDQRIFDVQQRIIDARNVVKDMRTEVMSMAGPERSGAMKEISKLDKELGRLEHEEVALFEQRALLLRHIGALYAPTRTPQGTADHRGLHDLPTWTPPGGH